MPDLIVAHDDGRTSPSTRLPGALLGRYRAGESVSDLANDYDLPEDQVAWGLELAALREVIAGLPGQRRIRALIDAHERLKGFRVYRLIACRRPYQEVFDSRCGARGARP